MRTGIRYLLRYRWADILCGLGATIFLIAGFALMHTIEGGM